MLPRFALAFEVDEDHLARNFLPLAVRIDVACDRVARTLTEADSIEVRSSTARVMQGPVAMSKQAMIEKRVATQTDQARTFMVDACKRLCAQQHGLRSKLAHMNQARMVQWEDRAVTRAVCSFL